jgi:hypothetical protein
VLREEVSWRGRSRCGARRRHKAGDGGGGALLRPEVGDDSGLWATWAKRGVKPGGPGWCQSGLADRPTLMEVEASEPGRFVGKWKKQFQI